MRREVSRRRERFFAEYERCGDGVRAAVAAGYDERLAAFTARRLLSGAGREPSPSPATPPITNVTREMVVSGLYKEASGTGKESSQANRIKAWELLAKVLGLLGQSGQSGRSGDEADEPLVVHFDIRLDEESRDEDGNREAGR